MIQRLSGSAHRVTRPRKAVIEALAAAENLIDCTALLKAARRKYAKVGLATVYRTIDMLEEIGAVRRVMIDGRAHVVSCADQSLHFHLVCQKCHTVAEMHGEEEEGLRALARASGFEPINQPVEITGLCANCR